jgi:hypothetical protein
MKYHHLHHPTHHFWYWYFDALAQLSVAAFKHTKKPQVLSILQFMPKVPVFAKQDSIACNVAVDSVSLLNVVFALLLAQLLFPWL